jgi:hypothetical protein
VGWGDAGVGVDARCEDEPEGRGEGAVPEDGAEARERAWASSSIVQRTTMLLVIQAPLGNTHPMALNVATTLGSVTALVLCGVLGAVVRNRHSRARHAPDVDGDSDPDHPLRRRRDQGTCATPALRAARGSTSRARWVSSSVN